jgi:hypothetical protein
MKRKKTTQNCDVAEGTPEKTEKAICKLVQELFTSFVITTKLYAPLRRLS